MADQEIKKPVGIIQELIAIHTTRVEVATRLIIDELKPALQDIENQSKYFITSLMEELSNYGDAVQSVAERENDYQQIWTANLGKLNSLNENESKAILNNLELSLRNIYKEILLEDNALPDSLLQIIIKQQAALKILN